MSGLDISRNISHNKNLPGPYVAGLAFAAAAAVTLGTSQAQPCSDAILISTAGNLTVRFSGDTADVALTLPVGIWELSVSAIRSGGTAAGAVLWK